MSEPYPGVWTLPKGSLVDQIRSILDRLDYDERTADDWLEGRRARVFKARGRALDRIDRAVETAADQQVSGGGR